METIAHGNYHDAGHNQYGRAPDTDCASEVDTEGHLLGGPWRFAVYAPTSTATCLQQSIGDEPVSNVHNVDECIPDGESAVSVERCNSQQFRAASADSPLAGYVPSINADDLWMMVGCFVSDQDGNSHADPWADGQRWVDEDWYGCRQKAVDEGTCSKDTRHEYMAKLDRTKNDEEVAYAFFKYCMLLDLSCFRVP